VLVVGRLPALARWLRVNSMNVLHLERQLFAYQHLHSLPIVFSVTAFVCEASVRVFAPATSPASSLVPLHAFVPRPVTLSAGHRRRARVLRQGAAEHEGGQDTGAHLGAGHAGVRIRACTRVAAYLAVSRACTESDAQPAVGPPDRCVPHAAFPSSSNPCSSRRRAMM
jgi:hypothetical protein